MSGPRAFSGKTDPKGQLLHPDVPLGEYTVTLTVEYFKGRSYSQTRTFEEKVTLTKSSGLQVRRVGPTPEVAFRRTRGYLFDSRKSFLMPRAAKQLLEGPKWWRDRAPSHLLIVGHTDVTGDQGFNDVLSQARADVVKAFLEQDVETWLAYYDEKGATKWGSREDRLMIRSLPDFATRLSDAGTNDASSKGGDTNNANGASTTNGPPSSSGTTNTSNGTKPKKPESIVEWFQRTRGLEVDDIAGPKTRRALISEYMGVGSVNLRETPGYPVSIATLGEGEDFPLAETGLPLDVAASNKTGGATARGAGANGTGGTGATSHDEPNPLDRRVELFFFDTDFGILPPVGDVGGPEYLEWRKRVEEESDVAVEKEVQEAKYLAVRNAQFRTASAVMLPEGDAPSSDSKTPLTSVGILATALRYNEEHPGHSMLVAGHTDSVGGDKDNDKLSAQRAQLVHAVLTGGAAGRSTFQDIANDTGTVSDWKQILKWASAAFPSVEELTDDEDAEQDGQEAPPSDDATSNSAALGDGAASNAGSASTGAAASGAHPNSRDDSASDAEPEDGALGTGFTACDPGAIDDNAKTGADAVKAFQTAYNENYKLLGGSGKISVDGEVGKQTWGAIYDLYQYNLAQELGETFDGLKELQGLVHLLPTTKPYVGFGESAPLDGSYENDADKQVNRRVEVLFFEYGQEPDVALLDEDPKVSELYHGEVFKRVELEPMVSARKWFARWEPIEPSKNKRTIKSLLASNEKPLLLSLHCLGITSGVAISFLVEPVEGPPNGTHVPRAVPARVEPDLAKAEFSDWDFDTHPEFAGLLKDGQEFPVASFRFTAVGGGRQVHSRNVATYSDDVVIQVVIEGSPSTPIVDAKYLLMTAWGQREGKTDKQGILTEKGLRPGGLCLVVNQTTFVSLNQVEYNWDHG